MLGIAAQAAASAILDIDEQRARVRAIEGADGMADVGRKAKIIATGGGLGSAARGANGNRPPLLVDHAEGFRPSRRRTADAHVLELPNCALALRYE